MNRDEEVLELVLGLTTASTAKLPELKMILINIVSERAALRTERDELQAVVVKLREGLSRIQGKLHVLNHNARLIDLWKDDPNATVQAWAQNIQATRLEVHDMITKMFVESDKK
ncbi:MAG: hypothetical protein ACREGB_01655 [Candidatus Saccharimonadales bacterium]